MTDGIRQIPPGLFPEPQQRALNDLFQQPIAPSGTLQTTPVPAGGTSVTLPVSYIPQGGPNWDTTWRIDALSTSVTIGFAVAAPSGALFRWMKL